MASKTSDLLIVESAVEAILKKTGDTITERIIDQMRPHFVKKQVIQQAVNSGLFGKNPQDSHAIICDESEAEEPKAAKADLYQQNIIPHSYRQA